MILLVPWVILTNTPKVYFHYLLCSSGNCFHQANPSHAASSLAQMYWLSSVNLKKTPFLYLPPAGLACTGQWMLWAQGRVGCDEEMMTGRLFWRKGGGLQARPKNPPQIYFWKWVDLKKESWQAMAKPPIRLRNSWKSSCPSELVSSFFIMRSRTPGSFWFCKGNNNHNNDTINGIWPCTF